jgi:hypothetical protein
MEKKVTTRETVRSRNEASTPTFFGMSDRDDGCQYADAGLSFLDADGRLCPLPFTLFSTTLLVRILFLISSNLQILVGTVA